MAYCVEKTARAIEGLVNVTTSAAVVDVGATTIGRHQPPVTQYAKVMRHGRLAKAGCRDYRSNRYAGRIERRENP